MTWVKRQTLQHSHSTKTAALMMRKSGVPVGKICSDLNIPSSTFRDWTRAPQSPDMNPIEQREVANYHLPRTERNSKRGFSLPGTSLLRNLMLWRISVTQWLPVLQPSFSPKVDQPNTKFLVLKTTGPFKDHQYNQ